MQEAAIFSKTSRLALGPAQPPIQLVLGFFPGINTDHSPPSSAKVRNEWSYTSIPLYAFSLDRVTFPFFYLNFPSHKNAYTQHAKAIRNTHDQV
jgi:hypothetical protein